MFSQTFGVALQFLGLIVALVGYWRITEGAHWVDYFFYFLAAAAFFWLGSKRKQRE